MNTAEIRARHPRCVVPTEGYSICKMDDQSWPCDAMRLCNALDEALAEIVSAEAFENALAATVPDNYDNGQLSQREAIQTWAIQLCNEMDEALSDLDLVDTTLGNANDVIREQNDRLTEQAAEIERLNQEIERNRPTTLADIKAWRDNSEEIRRNHLRGPYA